MHDPATHTVQQQYEDFPYPSRDPADEATRLVRTWLEDLPKINDYCFGGRQSFRNGFRVLVAGGGTGDATIFLAEQLRATDAQIVHLDMSSASIDTARERARLRGLDNIVWIQASLLALPTLGLAPFDYINCSGVLHHLPDPEQGLRALESVLKPAGALGVMVYAEYGRTAVYQMQQLLREINAETPTLQGKLGNAKQVLQSLPASNWFARAEDLYADHKAGDAGIVDLLLHAQDRAYTVEALYAWFEDAHGLHLQLTDVHAGNAAYLPHMILGANAPELLQKIAAMPLRRQHAIAELLSGRIKTHSFYATRAADTRAPYGDVDFIPFYFHDPVTGPMMEKVFNANRNNGKTFLLRHEHANVACTVRPGRYGPRILREIDGRKCFGEIFDAVRADPNFRGDRPSDATLFDDFRPSFDALRAMDRLLLRHRDIAPPA